MQRVVSKRGREKREGERERGREGERERGREGERERGREGCIKKVSDM